MTDAPERIWAYAGSFKMWRDHKTDRPHTQTEYIRADLATHTDPLTDPRVVSIGLRAALNIVAGLPTPDSEVIMNGHEDAYRAIEAALAAIEKGQT